jgi:hypothetical protein
MRQTEGELVHTLMDYVEVHYGHEAVAEAWDEFTLWEDIPLDPENEPEFEASFIPWLLFNWLPDPAETERKIALPEIEIARRYGNEMGERLSPYQRRFIDEICSQPYSFFVVTHIEPGEKMTLRDLMLERTVTVFERQATTTLKKGAILFTRIVTLDDTSIMVGCAPHSIPPIYLSDFAAIREQIIKKRRVLDKPFLLEADIELRGLYYDIRAELLSPAMPQLHNTDGELLQLIQLHYALSCSPREALEALASLALSEVDDLLGEAEFDQRGNLASVELPWLRKGNRVHADWDNTVLGHIRIEAGQLTIDVNSQQRADAVKRKLVRRLGKRASLQRSVIQSTERLLEERSPNGSTANAAAPEVGEDLNSLPEVRAMIRGMAEQHWRSWLDTPLPALGGKTPRKAAASAAGRKRLDDLFLEFEYRTDPTQPFAPDIPALRRQLGME